MLYPFTFKPIYKERLWGSRKLAPLYGKNLPSNLPIGESWEVADRPEDESAIANGPLEGRSLHWVLEYYSRELLGAVPALKGRFPLLVKILDASETLSLQVHPPVAVAEALGGEPKTEMWYVAHAAPGAELFVGLRRGVARAEFEERLRTGGVAQCLHRVPVKAGDAMYVPSGRVHGIGAGCVIFEIQQNSDTTYRVFDWNRTGPDGQGRELHIAQSLDCIDFGDVEPSLIQTEYGGRPEVQKRPLVSCPYFDVETWRVQKGATVSTGGEAVIVAVVAGELHVHASHSSVALRAGEFCLVPACLETAALVAQTDAEFLLTRPR